MPTKLLMVGEAPYYTTAEGLPTLLIQQDLYFGNKIPDGKAAALESLK